MEEEFKKEEHQLLDVIRRFKEERESGKELPKNAVTEEQMDDAMENLADLYCGIFKHGCW